MPQSSWRRTTWSIAWSVSAGMRAASTGLPSASATSRSASTSGLGRLPMWVVRMRSVLRFIALNSLSRRLLGRPAIPAVAARHRSQAEVFPQGPAFVFAAKQPAALQLGDDHVDEVLAAARQGGGRNVETIAAGGFEPLLHEIGDVGGRADPRRAGDAGAQVELADRRLLPLHPLDERGAHAAQFLAAQHALGHRLVQLVAR